MISPIFNVAEGAPRLRPAPSPRHHTGRSARQGDEGRHNLERLAWQKPILFLLCAGSYAINSPKVLIRANDPPPRRVFVLVPLIGIQPLRRFAKTELENLASSRRPFSPLGDVLDPSNHPEANFAEPEHGQDAEDAAFQEPP
ncbi:hypothetical protein NKI56_32205 [Mesorhizobium sp. M0622]|uniref:hypothetical protein n=1 Tax=unclassified Mesorhizobium TaxID=325217 RepID=UPI00333BFC89